MPANILLGSIADYAAMQAGITRRLAPRPNGSMRRQLYRLHLELYVLEDDAHALQHTFPRWINVPAAVEHLACDVAGEAGLPCMVGPNVEPTPGRHS